MDTGQECGRVELVHGNYRIDRRCIRVHGKDEAGSGLLAAGRLVRVQLFACVIGAKRLGGVAGSLGLMLDMEDGRSVSQPLLCSFFFCLAQGSWVREGKNHLSQIFLCQPAFRVGSTLE